MDIPKGYKQESRWNSSLLRNEYFLVPLDKPLTSWRTNLESLLDLKSLPSDDSQDKNIRIIQDPPTIWMYDKHSIAVEDMANIITPVDNPEKGRWTLFSSVGSGGTQLPDPVGNDGLVLLVANDTYTLGQIPSSSIAPAFAISFTNSIPTKEIGATVANPTFQVLANYQVVDYILSSSYGNETAFSVDLNIFDITSAGTFTLNSGGLVTFSLNVSNPLGETTSATSSIRWNNAVYYGVYDLSLSATLPLLIPQLSKRLSNSNITFSIDAGATDYIWYAIPHSFGTPTFSVGGFAGGFALIGNDDITNVNGLVISYDFYRSDNLNLGSITVNVG